MKRTVLVLLLLLLVILSGCGATLETVDLSGEYYLYHQNVHSHTRMAESFVEIDSYTWGNSGNVDYLLERNLSSSIGTFTLNRFWREKWHGLELIDYNVNIGHNNYLVGADFTQSHIYIEIRDSNGDIVPGLEYVSSDYHTSYDALDLDDLSWTERELTQTGTEFFQFMEPDTKKTFLIDGSYEAVVKVSRDIFIDPDTKEKKKKDENYYINFKADLNIAYSAYLSGEKRLANKDGKEVQLNFYIFDRNLDGEFNQDDHLYLEYPSGLIFNNQVILPLNKPVSIHKKNKTKYRLSLSPPGSSPFILNGFQQIKDASAGYSGVILIRDDGSLWFRDNQTQLKGETLRKIGKSYKTASVGDGFFLAVKEDGTVWSWGKNFYGRLGDGTEVERKNPVQVVGLNDVISVSAGKYHSLALKADGTVWAWGKNAYGVLGAGTDTPKFTPVQINGLSGITHIIAGEKFSLAVNNDGAVWFWGSDKWLFHQNETGKLHAGATLPVKIKDLNNVKTLTAGDGHFLALKNDGTLWAWGDNAHGQLGSDAETYQTLPVQILSGVKDIAAGAEYSLAVKEDGTVWIWGDCQGNLCNDDFNDKSITPVMINSLANINSVVTGEDFCLAVDQDHRAWVWGKNPLIEREKPYVLLVEKESSLE